MEPPEPAVAASAGRQYWLTAVALAAAVAIAWTWLLTRPGSTSAHSHMMIVDRAAVWTPSYLLAAFAMWALMMVAMMLPSAAPMVLLYRRMAGPSGAAGYTLVFTAAYLAIWLCFSAAAAAAQALLLSAGLVSEMALALGDGRLAGALLVLAGLYQLTPLKQACLEACRSPLDFIMRLSRPGWSGAFRVGVAHGLYCLGCCWALMLLLFVGGVMNLAWVALIAVLVALEKLLPAGARTSAVVALACFVGGIALAL